MAGMPPATGGRRISWAEVPAEVRTAIEQLLGKASLDWLRRRLGRSQRNVNMRASGSSATGGPT
ncbi:hypothetical protein ABZ912_31320 [Nonomuraea angiospora]|uniref:hypothetical protein n=1 Tax=Nonomuraea angiospora TaxID=46172 RepID=UPI0033DAD3D3